MIRYFLGKLIPIPITLLSVYLVNIFSLEKFFLFIPLKHSFEISLLIYSTMLSALWILLELIWEKQSHKVQVVYSVDNEAFIPNNKILASFKEDYSKVFIKIVMDGSVDKLANLNIRIALPKKVKTQKNKENSEYIKTNERMDLINIPIRNIINYEKKSVSSETFIIPILLIKEVETIDSYVETIISKEKFNVSKCKFSKNQLKLL